MTMPEPVQKIVIAPDAERECIRSILSNEKDWTVGERECLKWQYPLVEAQGSFMASLWKCMIRADEENLNRLAAAFPEHVRALQAYRSGELVRRFEAAGVGP